MDTRYFLETPRLRLRSLTEDDLDRVVTLDNDPGVRRFIDGGRPVTRETVRTETLRRLLGRGFWAAEERSTGAWLGWFCLEPESEQGWRVVELGYRLRRAAWGHGYATEGARALVRAAFTDLGTERVTAQTMTVNTASRRVLEKAGLTYVRTFFEEWPETIEGSEQGDVAYELTREAWKG
ncbi:GNAT family N-acetyltransferase [Streptomyces scopuliridis]|uniref:GNAT family acetyltransferase n=1 Tax=Streptomyces scopuliridis RB72 TaxID=1440053 RepID=A0A2T7SQC0_9ACTN|nr:GNAT family N-acetyltransferase [Streptomyces scopuliridis]PVE04420.1 GNAT family acetyltransferase [Streptomyces scopuliridis RB72]PVE05169.1 GNAT family acetyltransferase [Streptomyces scopuliridis RB72]